MTFDFTKNKTVENLEGVPEKYHGLYEQTDDGYAITAAASAIVDDFISTSTSLRQSKSDKKAVSDENAKRRQANKAFEDIAEEFGIEHDDDNPLVDALKARINELVESSKNGKELKVNMDKLKADMDKRVNEVTMAKDGEIAGMTSALSKHMVGEVATRAIAEAKGSVDLLMPIVKDRCKVIKDGDDYVVRVVDAQGDLRFDGTGEYMSISGLVTELKQSDNFARAFESDVKVGGGTPPGGPGKVIKPAAGEKTSQQKISDGLRTMQQAGLKSTGVGAV